MGFLDKLWSGEEEEKVVEEKQTVNTSNNGAIRLFNNDKKDKKEEEFMPEVKYAIINPRVLSEAQTILGLVKERVMVTFSVENLNKEDAQRLIDMVSGATSAMSGKVYQVTAKVLTSVPAGVIIEEYTKTGEEF
jgi:cell division protein sepF